MLETRGSDTNGRTQVLFAVDALERPQEASRDAFLRAWPRIRPALTALGRRGFVVVAQRWKLGLGELDAAFCMELPLDDERSVHRVVGRHTRADLVLRGDDSISLRHLLLSAWIDEGRPVLRALDVGSDARFSTEDGTDVASMLADGSCFLSVGSWNLMALYTEPDVFWPEDAEEAWDQLPPREAVDARRTWPRPSLRARVYPQLKGEDVSSTQVFHLDDPEQLAELPAESPLAVGALFLPRRRTVRLSVEALTRGVLIGRYERCGVDQDLLGADPSVSRIHLCLVQDPTGLWAVDMASTNGTRAQGEKVRSGKLEREADILLARTTRLRWEMA